MAPPKAAKLSACGWEVIGSDLERSSTIIVKVNLFLCTSLRHTEWMYSSTDS